MPDFLVKLGSFVFRDTEVPESITWGGSQRLVKHLFPGGKRIFQGMGREELDLSWSGLLLGRQAVPRAQSLDRLRINGRPIELSWHRLKYKVVLESAEFSFERFYQVPYTLRCCVVEDLVVRAGAPPNAPIDFAIRGDAEKAGGLAGLLGNSGISSAVGAVQSAVSGVTNFLTAGQEQIRGVLGPTLDAQDAVRQYVGDLGGVVREVTTLGGILPFNPVAEQAEKLLNSVDQYTNLSTGYQLDAALGRLGSNLELLSGSSRGLATAGQSVTVAGGNLFDLARQVYGKATQWSPLAQANGLQDPMLQGVQTLRVPSNPPDTGEVPNA